MVNGSILEPLSYDVKKQVYVGEERVIEGQGVKVILFNNIENKDCNGVDFIFNNRIIIEEEKSPNINWNSRIRTKNHSYKNFHAEIFVRSNNVEEIGVNPSHNSIDFNNQFIKKIVEFLNEEIGNNREFYKKPTTTVQVEVPIEDLNTWKEKIEKYEGECKCAKDVIEKLYKKGVNQIMEWGDD